MTKFFNIFKKPCFWPIFPISGAKKHFLVNPVLSGTTSHGFLASCPNLEKTNNTIPRKRPDGWKDERMDGRKVRQTLIHSNLPANDGGPIAQKNSEVNTFHFNRITYLPFSLCWTVNHKLAIKLKIIPHTGDVSSAKLSASLTWW